MAVRADVLPRSPFVLTGLCTLHVTPKPKSSSMAFSCLTATLCTFSQLALQVRYPLPVGGESMCCAQQPFLGIRNELSASFPSEIIFLTLYVRADKIMCLRSVCNLFLSLWPLKLFILPQHVHVPRMLVGCSASFQGIFT